MSKIKEIIKNIIRRFKMDWDAGRPIPIPVRDDE